MAFYKGLSNDYAVFHQYIDENGDSDSFDMAQYKGDSTLHHRFKPENTGVSSLFLGAVCLPDIQGDSASKQVDWGRGAI